MRIHKEHRIECTPERFWEMMFDPEIDKRLNVEGLGVERCEMIERNVEGGLWRMKVRIQPKDNLPGFIKKLVGDSFGYVEERTYEKGSDRARSVMVPTTMADKLHMSYEMRVVPDGQGACRRIMDWTIEVKIFAIGGQIEKFAGGEVERGVENSARFYNDELRKAAR